MWGIYISSNGLPMCWSIRVFLSLAVVCPVVGVSICVFRYVCLQERSVHVLGGECLADCAQLWTRGWGCASSAADTPFPGACLLIDPAPTFVIFWEKFYFSWGHPWELDILLTNQREQKSHCKQTLYTWGLQKTLVAAGRRGWHRAPFPVWSGGKSGAHMLVVLPRTRTTRLYPTTYTHLPLGTCVSLNVPTYRCT